MDQPISVLKPLPSRPDPPPGPGRLRTVLQSVWQHRWLILAALTIALGTAWGGAHLFIGPEVSVYPVVRSDLVRTVVATGHVETPFRVEIASQITGTVQEVVVEEGQTVRRGQPLVALETSELRSAVVEADGAVAQAEARLRQLKELTLPSAQEALKQAQANLANAEATFNRANELAKSGYATRSAFDDATKAVDVARTQVRTAELGRLHFESRWQRLCDGRDPAEPGAGQCRDRTCQARLSPRSPRLGTES